MARLLSMNNKPLPLNLLLVAGSPYPFKVSGLGSDKKHVVLMASKPQIIVEVVKAEDKNSEQTLLLKPDDKLAATVQAALTAYLASKLEEKDGQTTGITLTIEPKIALPDEKGEEGIVSRMLLAEAITPGDPNFVAKDSKETMRWMLHVMLNRMKFGSEYFGAGKGASTLTKMITSPNQVKGFDNYPKLAKGPTAVINGVMRIANTSGHKDTRLYRQYLRDAMEIAASTDRGKDPCSTGLYGWRTAGSGSPGSNFEKFKTFGGQDFYTLTESFRKDPLQRTRADR